MSDCIFCKLASGEIPTNVAYEDDKIFCFHDAEPQAPVHVLVIPKKHIASLDDLKPEDEALRNRPNQRIAAVCSPTPLIKCCTVSTTLLYRRISHWKRPK